MNDPRTVGVLGTLVWDRIFGLDSREPTEGWGGIAYSLSAMSAATDRSWRILAIVKVGADLAEPAQELLRGIPRIDDSAVVVVPEQNNRVEIRYKTERRRSERLVGGVPGWRWEELESLLDKCDGLYVNFISGREIDLEAVIRLRTGYRGASYADLHSLFLSTAVDGLRVPRRLERPEPWLSAFDAVQMNEDEFDLLGPPGDPWSHLDRQVGPKPGLVLVTLGSMGVAFWEADQAGTRRSSVEIPGAPQRGDPTGCGDVWGATMFAHRLQGRDVRDAMLEAHRAAGRSVAYRGAEGLHRHLSDLL